MFTEEPFLYQEIGPKALELFNLGMNYSQITEQLQVTDKTVSMGIRYVQKLREANRLKTIRCRTPRRQRRGPFPPFPFDDN